jgi:hypothetical protein
MFGRNINQEVFYISHFPEHRIMAYSKSDINHVNGVKKRLYPGGMFVHQNHHAKILDIWHVA